MRRMDEASTHAGTIRPLDAAERRVLGVLVEKAKTTPDQYPLSLNALVTGCNQKSNRDPVMTLDEEQAARALDGLRTCGAAAAAWIRSPTSTRFAATSSGSPPAGSWSGSRRPAAGGC